MLDIFLTDPDITEFASTSLKAIVYSSPTPQYIKPPRLLAIALRRVSLKRITYRFPAKQDLIPLCGTISRTSLFETNPALNAAWHSRFNRGFLAIRINYTHLIFNKNILFSIRIRGLVHGIFKYRNMPSNVFTYCY